MPDGTGDVESYLAGLDHPLKQALVKLRAAILRSNAAITDHIKWNAPSFLHGGDDRVTFRLPPGGRGLQLVFHRGARKRSADGFAFTDPSGLVAWAGADRGVVSLGSAAEVAARTGAIVALVNAWVRAVDAGASPGAAASRRSRARRTARPRK